MAMAGLRGFILVVIVGAGFMHCTSKMEPLKLDVSNSIINLSSSLISTRTLPLPCASDSSAHEGGSAHSSTVAAIDKLLWDNKCIDLYIDIGTNIGVQPRKLYEPSCYPGAYSIPLFSRVFGHKAIEDKSVCAIGFEPNIRHAPRLLQVEAHLKRKGVRVKSFTTTGISGNDENATFFSDGKYGKEEWGGGIFASRIKRGARMNAGNYPVTVVSLHSILGAVKAYGKIRNLLMKLDIEGSEYKALANAAAHRVLCSAANTTSFYIEQHPQIVGAYKVPPPPGLVNTLFWMTTYTEGCTTKLESSDDETFLHDTTNKSDAACYLPRL